MGLSCTCVPAKRRLPAMPSSLRLLWMVCLCAADSHTKRCRKRRRSRRRSPWTCSPSAPEVCPRSFVLCTFRGPTKNTNVLVSHPLPNPIRIPDPPQQTCPSHFHAYTRHWTRRTGWCPAPPPSSDVHRVRRELECHYK